LKKKDYLVKWSKICRAKKKGGMEVKNLRKMNISLLCKWWWMLENEEGIWQQLVNMKYIKNFPCLLGEAETVRPLYGVIS
jgi:hypothetical protein